MKDKNYRYELKYLCHDSEILIEEARLNQLLQKDDHVAPKGLYTIRSLYFDDYDKKCFYQNESGVDPREKYRIRMYEGNTDYLVLECKRKEKGMTQKESVHITPKQYHDIINGNLPLGNCDDPLLRRFLLKVSGELYRPSVIVEYDRVPYVNRDGNVRVTFDLNIRASAAVGTFLETGIKARPIMPNHLQMMEVKYSVFLPAFIKDALQLDSLRQTAFSKYYLCKKFSEGGLFL